MPKIKCPLEDCNWNQLDGYCCLENDDEVKLYTKGGIDGMSCFMYNTDHESYYY